MHSTRIVIWIRTFIDEAIPPGSLLWIDELLSSVAAASFSSSSAEQEQNATVNDDARDGNAAGESRYKAEI